MAGDKKGEQRKVIRQEGDYARGLSQNTRASVLEPQLRQFRDLYMQTAPQQIQDYGTTMSGYQDFAKTGGYSPTDVSNIRSRALSPTRAVYQNALRNVGRQRTLQGGYSPGYGTLMSRMAREQGQGLSDAATNTEAALAQMVQQGRLQGLGGATSLYGTSPGMAETFGRQVLGATDQLGTQVGREMGLSTDLIQAHQMAQQLPGKWEGTLGRIGDIAGLAKDVIYPFVQ